MKRIFLLLFLENSEKLESDFDFSDLIKIGCCCIEIQLYLV